MGVKRASGNIQTPAKEFSVNRGAMSQLLTRDWSQSDDTPGVTPGAPPTQQPPLPQSQARMKSFQCKLTFDVVRVMSLYDRGRIVTVNSTKGVRH